MSWQWSEKEHDEKGGGKTPTPSTTAEDKLQEPTDASEKSDMFGVTTWSMAESTPDPSVESDHTENDDSDDSGYIGNVKGLARGDDITDGVASSTSTFAPISQSQGSKGSNAKDKERSYGL